MFLNWAGIITSLVCLGGAIKDGAPWWGYFLIAAVLLVCLLTFPETDHFGHPVRRGGYSGD